MPRHINETECPRCRRIGSVQDEEVVRGNEPFVNYRCGACRYSWQVKDQAPRKRLAKRRWANSGGPHRHDR